MNINTNLLKVGDIVSETQYYKVTGKNVNGITGNNINFTNEKGSPIQVGIGIVSNDMFSANQFTEEKKVTATELAEIFSKVGDVVFEVSFNKLPQAKDINETINGLNGGSFPSNKQLKEAITNAYKGEERILRGYLLSIEPLMGRAKVVDLEIRLDESNSDPGYRLVDFRQLNYLINRGVKYMLN